MTKPYIWHLGWCRKENNKMFKNFFILLHAVGDTTRENHARWGTKESCWTCSNLLEMTIKVLLLSIFVALLFSAFASLPTWIQMTIDERPRTNIKFRFWPTLLIRTKIYERKIRERKFCCELFSHFAWNFNRYFEFQIWSWLGEFLNDVSR